MQFETRKFIGVNGSHFFVEYTIEYNSELGASMSAIAISHSDDILSGTITHRMENLHILYEQFSSNMKILYRGDAADAIVIIGQIPHNVHTITLPSVYRQIGQVQDVVEYVADTEDDYSLISEDDYMSHDEYDI